MLLKFAFENFLSFKKSATINFEASSNREMPENTMVFPNTPNDLRVLKSIAIYGANASGKSNILKAFMLVRNLVIYSASDTKSEHIHSVNQYKLDASTENGPSLFEGTILIDGNQYRYGFLITKERRGRRRHSLRVPWWF